MKIDRQRLKEKLATRIRPLTNDLVQSLDFAEWYIQLGPVRMATIIRELINEDSDLTRGSVVENELKLVELGFAKKDLQNIEKAEGA